VKQIELFCRGRLEGAEVDALEKHLEHCEHCRSQKQECLGNLNLEADLHDLARALRQSETEILDDAAASDQVASALPEIEGYQLIEQLGEGGQGVVYRAEQLFPQREVVIKLVRETLRDSGSARKRFEREILIAGKLRHPNIVTILDSGVLAGGHRYCAMEYIRGVPLTTYVHENRLPLRKMLGLFAQVCEAVQYAHQRGIMHRDLKPSNILVDASGTPKVVDFGLARSIVDVVDRDISQTGQVVGAPAYLSPEQTRGNPDEIDVRTDVYSLGVVLYELLTGAYPYEVDSDWHALISTIRQQDPTPPSDVWKDGLGIHPDVSAGAFRSRMPQGCPIDRDLETIVLVALRKDPERRYQTAGELGRDIHHYLQNEPLDARRDSLWYLIRKQASRYRRQLTVAALVLLILIVSLTALFLQRQAIARQQAELERNQARSVLAGFVNSPVEAVQQLSNKPPVVHQLVTEYAKAAVASDAFTERIAGARTSIVTAPAEFWTSVDGGQLWKRGEWLEVAHADWPANVRAAILSQLKEKAQSGSDRERYVAFCLLGEMSSPQDRNDIVRISDETARTHSHPGVTSAAVWAARKVGHTILLSRSPAVVNDSVTDMVFVPIPAPDRFRPGSPPAEFGRSDNENRSTAAVAIDSIHVSATEVTRQSFTAFLQSETPDDASLGVDVEALLSLSDTDIESLTDVELCRWYAVTRDFNEFVQQSSDMDVAQFGAPAMQYVSLTMARSYCQWLSDQARLAGLSHHYRLPTEAEWEYACRAGNKGPFCYGDSERYLDFFANCRGRHKSHHVAESMPNWFGLFDMHGGLWEWTSSEYLFDEHERGAESDRKLFVKRGGAFYSPAVRCRSAQRNHAEAESVDYYTGMRLVLELQQP
jgi:serine/threonine protein kinase/formylglycine-generating enzyme required for sulfatase activity